MGSTEAGTNIMAQVCFFLQRLTWIFVSPCFLNTCFRARASCSAQFMEPSSSSIWAWPCNWCGHCCEYYKWAEIQFSMCFIYVGWPFVLLSNSINPPESDRYPSHSWIKNYFLPLGIEDWIREKADYRLAPSGARFAWPYDVGRWNNLRQVGACKSLDKQQWRGHQPAGDHLVLSTTWWRH